MAKARFKKPKKLKMSKRSEKALDKAIKHWYRVRDEDANIGTEECALCGLYYINKLHWHNKCINCPVYLKISHKYCSATPYRKYADARGIVSEPKRKRLAQAEIEFLQSCYY